MDSVISEPCKLKRLASNAAHTAYKDLRALLEVLPSKVSPRLKFEKFCVGRPSAANEFCFAA